MADQLFLFQALTLRVEFDRRIVLLEKFFEKTDRDFSFRTGETSEKKEPVAEFVLSEVENELKKLQTKRVKLNQEIQKANFTNTLNFKGEEVSLAEALDIRKQLKKEIDILSKRVNESAYKRIVHKEERDIAHEPEHSFRKAKMEYELAVTEIRRIEDLLHIANHKTVVNFREE